MMKRRILASLGYIFMVLSLGGCADGPDSRLHDLLGKDVSRQSASQPVWPQLEQIGLLVHSDSTGPGAAPAIPSKHLDTLSRRTAQVLKQGCGVDSVVPVEFSSIKPNAPNQGTSKRFKISGNGKELSHALLVILSSKELTGPTKVGEANMMTQISGIAIENFALAELALVRLGDNQVVIEMPAKAQETLDLIDAPIGEQPLSKEEALAVLRARAAQGALDKSLRDLEQWCGNTSAKT